MTILELEDEMEFIFAFIRSATKKTERRVYMPQRENQQFSAPG